MKETNWYKPQDNMVSLCKGLQRAKTLEQAFDVLKSIPNFGNFFTWQVLCDFLEARLLRLTDSWACLGPGACKGLNFALNGKMKNHEGTQFLVRNVFTGFISRFDQNIFVWECLGYICVILLLKFRITWYETNVELHSVPKEDKHHIVPYLIWQNMKKLMNLTFSQNRRKLEFMNLILSHNISSMSKFKNKMCTLS